MQIYAGPPDRLRYVVVGGYTAEADGRAQGLTSLVAVPADDDRTELRPGGSLPLDSPTYVIAHPDRPWLLAVSEGETSRLSTVELAEDGTFRLLSTVETGGDGACHLALSADGRFVLVAHYGSGSVASCTLADDGSLRAVHLLSFEGSGPDPDRQATPHAHQVVLDPFTGEVLVNDLGTDQVHRLRLDDTGRLQTAADAVQLPPGSGPRHLVLTESVLVVACELSAELWLGTRTPDGWQQRQVVASSGTGATELAPSALRQDGDTVMVANRGPGTLAWFTLDQSSPGEPQLRLSYEHQSGGPVPRDAVLTADHAWVADQSTDTVYVYPRPAAAEAPTDFELPSPSAACIVLLSDLGSVAG